MRRSIGCIGSLCRVASASSSACAVRAGADLADRARQLRADRPGVVLHAPGTHDAPANFVGRVGAFLAELSFQLFGYAPTCFRPWSRRRLALLLVPAARRRLHQAHRRRAAASRCASAFLSLVARPRRRRRQAVPRRRLSSAQWLGGVLSDYLNRTGSIIVIADADGRWR